MTLTASLPVITADDLALVQQDQRAAARQLRLGIIASVSASVLFAVLFIAAAPLAGVGSETFVGWRILLTVPLMAPLMLLLGQWSTVRETLARLRRSPRLIPLVVLNTTLLAPQFYLFAWAPQHGYGLELTLGYLLLPLVVVLMGVLFFGERLGRLRLAAVSAAALGVGIGLVAAGGLHWTTLASAGGYAAYFSVRRASGLNSAGATFVELLLLWPLTLWLVLQPGAIAAVSSSPWVLPALIVVGLVSAGAILAYMLAARFLPLNLFGLLGYLEPLLMLPVALLLGGAIHGASWWTYGLIGVAVLLLAAEGARTLRRRDALPAEGAGH